MTYIMATFVILVMVASGVFVVVAVSSFTGPDHTRTGHRRTGAAPSGQDGALDAAEEELRMLYARGEIDREEFLQRKIDLER